MTTALSPQSSLTVAGLALECYQRGQGRPVLLLHGAGGPRPAAPFMDMLAERVRLIAPSHPGFGNSPLPDWFDSIDDLAYLYLDLLEQLELRDVVLIGLSMGGWTAAEMAIKCAHRLSKLILVDAVGCKFKDRETREIPDIWALPPAEVNKLTYYDPEKFAPKIDQLSDEALRAVARNREAAAMYLWEPYMHSPKLSRRLHRINVPTLLVWGAADGLVTPDYGRSYCAAIPGARMEIIDRAGHTPHNEQPEAFVETVMRFIEGA
jgi:pimeloyl-ACP methyl ester carboxylesterase